MGGPSFGAQQEQSLFTPWTRRPNYTWSCVLDAVSGLSVKPAEAQRQYAIEPIANRATELEALTDADGNCLLTILFSGEIAVAQLLRLLQKM
jgi:hypothetical protein